LSYANFITANSILQFFKTFHRYLPYASFGLFISLVPIFGQKSSQKIAQTKYLGNANFSQNQKSHETRTLCNSFEQIKMCYFVEKRNLSLCPKNLKQFDFLTVLILFDDIKSYFLLFFSSQIKRTKKYYCAFNNPPTLCLFFIFLMIS